MGASLKKFAKTVLGVAVVAVSLGVPIIGLSGGWAIAVQLLSAEVVPFGRRRKTGRAHSRAIADDAAALLEGLPQARSHAAPLPAASVDVPDGPLWSIQKRVERGLYRLRHPLTVDADQSDEIDLRELGALGLGLGVIFGDCLKGIVDAGSLVIFDPAEPAADGDLVAVQLDSEWLDDWIQSWADARLADEFERQYGAGGISNLGFKLLRHDRGQHVLCAWDSDGDEARIPLDCHRILGVVRAVVKADGDRGEMLYTG